MDHHAYYIEGSASAYEAYKEHLKPLYSRVYERFGIDEARELTGLAAIKNYQDTVLLLGIAAITSEAQQALLKLFEEPQQGTVFVVLLPHGVLLPTLRSRMLPYPEKSAVDEKNSLARRAGLRGLFYQQARTFLSASSKERSDFIAKLLKEEDKQKVRDFINALDIELYKKIKDPKAREALADIVKVRDYLRDRSPSLKMLLEHLALSLPII